MDVIGRKYCDVAYAARYFLDAKLCEKYTKLRQTTVQKRPYVATETIWNF